MYKSHPELLRKGTWSHEISKAEVKRCRDVGIEIIPKRNFSATHHTRLGEYGRMMSTSIISTTISPGGLLCVMTAPRKHTKTRVANHYGDTSRTNLDYIIESIELPAAERDKFAK